MSTTAVRSTARLTGIAPQFLVDDLEMAIAYVEDADGYVLCFSEPTA